MSILYFLPPMMSFVLILIGLNFREYISGLFGGLTLYLYGVYIIITPIPGFDANLNFLLGSVAFGFGAYVFIRGSMEKIQEVMP